ncbi:MAG: hypothetical protein IJA72_03225 [Clostridia bacterium]|nr:hypothetical protein [Clostridia bacterium]
MKYQDIHIQDKSYWLEWQRRFGSTQSLDNAYLYKALIAQNFNHINTKMTELMERPVDPSFKNNVIKTSETPPSDISSVDGRNVYFQLIIPAI